jgi:hypothetical protein
LPSFEISFKTDLNIEQPVPHLVASLLNEAKLNQSYVSSAVLEESQSPLMKRFTFFGLTPTLQTTIHRMKVSRPGIESISDSFLCVGWRGENFDVHEPVCLFELQQSDELQKWTSVILTPRLLFLIPRAMNYLRCAHPPIPNGDLIGLQFYCAPNVNVASLNSHSFGGSITADNVESVSVTTVAQTMPK